MNHRSRQAPTRIHCISHLARIRPIFCRQSSVLFAFKSHISCISLTSISLIAIQIKIIPTRRRLDPLIRLNSIHPSCPARPRLRIRPATIRLQHASHANHPRCHLNIDKGDGGAEEEGAGGVGRLKEFGDLEFEVFGGVDLLLGVLRLEVLVEYGDDVAVDLGNGKSEAIFAVGEGLT